MEDTQNLDALGASFLVFGLIYAVIGIVLLVLTIRFLHHGARAFKLYADRREDGPPIRGRIDLPEPKRPAQPFTDRPWRDR